MARVVSVALAVAVAISLGSARAAAQPLPSLKDPVNDFANVIDPATREELERRIRALHAASGDVVIVATVQTVEPFGTIEEYAVRLFEQAGIGDKEKDNGLLIVLAMKERAVRIEVGYGLEEFITDIVAGETIRQHMLPRFREGQYGQGLLDGATRIIHRLSEKRGVTLDGVPAAREVASTPNARQVLIGAVVGLIILLVIARAIRNIGGPRGPYGRRRRRSTWSGWHGGVGGFGGGWFGGGFGGGFGGFGGGGGGFGGFGGGMSGGGGASGRF